MEKSAAAGIAGEIVIALIEKNAIRVPVDENVVDVYENLYRRIRYLETLTPSEFTKK